ncbi:MAG: asparagine synthase-related protein [Gemmatimonadetes bacterium]|nr:asparagine synthase-related protein [Gemmatimonadota bacterium]
MRQSYVARIINLIEDESQDLRGVDPERASQTLLEDDPGSTLALEGSFALLARDGETVRMARSLDRPMRYFLAKETDGPLLVVSDRIDAIRDCLEAAGYGDQFHPSYTRMVPAHHVLEIRLIGCPDPNPVYRRFFDPPRGTLEPDVDAIGGAYVGALLEETSRWLDVIPGDAPIGVLFSGGIDSGAVLLAVHATLLGRGESPSRLKAFTLSVDGRGEDARQALEFLRALELELLGEVIEVTRARVDPLAAVRVIEDYKPLDVECAAVSLALLGGIRERYPSWRFLVDGDGGDENLKDYPIEENPKLTIRSVVDNRMLYHEGWGVDAIKHSLTYSGGMSRGCVRGYQPARHLGFRTFSPLAAPRVVAVSEAIPFAELTGGSHEALYDLKGRVVASGVRQHLDTEMPVFPKRRFQDGAVAATAAPFGLGEAEYRRVFQSLHA